MLRLDKYLADMQVGTRSEVKQMIRKGLVTVDGLIVKKPEEKVDCEKQVVVCSGAIVSYHQYEYYMLNKPAGVVSATEDPRDKTVIDLIEDRRRKDLFPAGRLDKDTEGLLLITNDGALAHDLLSPKKHVDKKYYAKIEGTVTEEDVELFGKGVDIGEKRVTLPAVLTILIISAFGLLFIKVTGNSIYNMISTWIQAPLRGILTGLPGYLLIFFLSTCFWVIGIHGTQVLKPVYQATMLEAVIANTDAAANGQTPQFILNETFISCFTTMGGAGCTIGLLFAMLLASKRSDHRTIAKLSLAPGLFNINETMTFGLPIVLNPIFMIPFILTPVITATFAYFMTVIGFCGKMIYAVPWTTPPLLIAWLGSGGSIGAVITQALCVVLSFIVYLPFVFAANKQEN